MFKSVFGRVDATPSLLFRVTVFWLSTMDVSTVKAEIKAWERSFKSTHGRDPSVQDIKQQPNIADKYRLYKKLSKPPTNSLPSTSTQRSSDPPSTPPRSRSRSRQPIPTLLLAQPRALETTAPLSSYNPFSPQKNKGKQKAAPSTTVQPRSNPFTSPFKSKSKPKPQPQDSPDAFPILKLPQPSKTPIQSPPAVSAISRARKRLRGEPVSPSPNKGKRRRITTQTQTTLPFTKLAPDSSSSEENDDDDRNSSFITDSPMKAPAGGKSFKLLFDESAAAANAGPAKGKSALGRTKSISTTRGLFGDKSVASVDDDVGWDMGMNTKGSKTDKRNIKPLMPNSTTSRRGNGSALSSKAKKSASPVNRESENEPETRKSAKRSLSDTDWETSDIPREPSHAGPSLLPPSPPPANASTSRSKQFTNTKGTKGKAKAVGRKKAKTADNHKTDDDDESSETDTSTTNVKIVDRTQTRFQRTADDDLDFDSDPILGYSRRGAPHGHEPSVPPDAELEGKFEVDLPDKLRRVLALESAESTTRVLREKRMVEGLVFGRRSTHYDPAKGGEIWDVGEDDLRVDGEEEVRRDTEGEDDWEGEPVPWEVGEL
ncbi:hypothetical protein Hypma_015732 [Hypsizygus marmoreus]|uniref:DNA replication regulator SLD2 n=1 Tax=Hypsizygus marmoreus TaxID=39966 RepID=A0A369KBG3_HYPMA|nr:hypothetical protein Hypma_015732 [Hypsizygus marmoreus]